MNRNEESSLPGITSMPSISRHVIEDLVANDNAPQMIDNTTPIRPSLRARSVTRSGTHQQHVTERRRIVTTDATDAAQQLIRFQIATATAEHELRTEGIHIDNAETELRSERLAIARLKLDTERAELEARKAVAEKLTWYAGKLAQFPQPPPRAEHIANRRDHHHTSNV